MSVARCRHESTTAAVLAIGCCKLFTGFGGPRNQAASSTTPERLHF